MKETKQEEGKFIGIAPLTGRKIYLTPEEEAILKKQRKTLFKTLWWIIGNLWINHTGISNESKFRKNFQSFAK